MNLQFKQQIQEQSTLQNAALDISYSPSQNKIAIIRYDRQIQFYNEQFQPTELIQTRGMDHTKITDTYLPTCIAWSSDSTLLAVGQSDTSVYIYNIGTNFEKKSIIGKCIVSAPVSAIAWASNASTSMASDVVIGCSNGDVWIYNPSQKKSELIFGSQAMQRLIQAKTSSVDRVATGNQGLQCPIINIHTVQSNQCLIVNQLGVAGLIDLNNLNQIQSVARNNVATSTSCLLSLKHSNQIFLATITIDNRIIVNSLQNGLAVQQIKVDMKKPIISSCTIQTGGSLLVASQEGIGVIQVIQSNPLQIKQSEIFKFMQNDASVKIATNNNATNILLAFSNAKIDCLQPSLNTSTYCNCQVITQALNKQILEVKGFKSQSLQLNDQIVFEAKKSSEIMKLHAYPEAQWRQCLSNNQIQQFTGYIAAIADKSIVVYSFQGDYMIEIETTMNVKDKLFFDVGEQNIILISRADLAEFQPFVIVNSNDKDNKQKYVISYPTVKQCCYPGKNLISCHLQQDNTLLVCHLGGDRNNLLIDQLQEQANLFDDFVQPITNLFTYQLQSIPDWIDLSPSGQLLLIRSINGNINVASTTQQSIQQLSTTMGNSVAFWAVPYDVLVGQEPSDTNVIVYYSPLATDVKPQVLQAPNNKEDVQLVGSRITKPQQGVQPAEVSLVLVNQSNNHETLLPLQTDTLTFTSLLQNKQAAAACLLLSRYNVTNKSQWQQLLQLAYSTRQFNIISRCLIALNMKQKAIYANKIFKDIQNKQIQFNSQLQQQAYEKAQIALLQDNLNEYDHQMQQAGKIQLAIEVYTSLKLFDRAVGLADPQQRQQLQKQQLEYYKETKQSILAAQLLCQQQDFNGAITLLLQDQAYISAFNVINRLVQTLGSNTTTYLNQPLILQCAQQLESSGHQALAGDLYASQALNQPLNALNSYKSAKLWQKALNLAQSVSPADVPFIEGDYGRWLLQLKQYSAAAQHFVNGNMLKEAISCYLKAQDTENSSKLLQQSNFDYQTSAILKLQLASILFYQNKIDEATKWFIEADQPLLAVQALLSVGEFNKAIQVVKSRFQGSMQKEVIKSEAQRILRSNTQQMGFQQYNSMQNMNNQYSSYNQYGNQQTPAQLASQILQKISSLSTCYGPQAAVSVYTAADMYDEAVQLLKEQQMWQELLAYVDKINYNNYSIVYQQVASQFQVNNNLKAAAQTLERLCYKLQKEDQTLHPYIDSCVQIFIQLQLYDQAIQVSQNVNDTQLLIFALINKIKAIQGSQQSVTDIVRNMKLVDQTALAAVKLDCFDFAIKLADFSSNSDNLKQKVWLEQAIKLQEQKSYQEADRYYTLAGAPLKSLQMWLSCNDFVAAESIVNNQLVGSEKITGQKLLKQRRAAVYVEQNNLQEAEKLYCELGMFATIIQAYQQRSMWKEAIAVAKLSGDAELKEKVVKGYMVEAEATNQFQNQNQQQNQDQNQDQLQLINTNKTWKQQLAEIMQKQDKQLITNTLFQHLQIIAEKIKDRTIQQSDITEDELMLHNLVDLSGENDILYKAVTIIITYIVKGIPRTIVDEKQAPKSCIQIVLGVSNPVESIIAICNAILSIEYTDQQFVGIMSQTASESSAYSICKQMVVNYKLRINNTAQYKQQEAKNPQLFIATSSKLSHSFEALQLICHLSQLLQSQQRSVQTLRDITNLTASLCRYVDLLPIDRCFYMAAFYSQQLQESFINQKSQQFQQIRSQYQNQSVVFYNTFLDIIELQPGTDITQLDLSPYKDCNIAQALQKQPRSPKIQYIQKQETLDATRQYIMQQSLQSNNDFQLPTEKCPFTPNCQSKIWICDINCKQCGKSSCVCSLTGMHTTKQGGQQTESVCKVCGCHSRKNQWNNWVDKTNSCCVCGELGQKV